MKIRIIFLSLFFLFSCQLLEIKSFYPSVEKKRKAKKSSFAVKNTWTELESQTQLPFEERIRQIDQFIERYQEEEIALPAYLLKAKLYLQNKKKEKACQTYHQATRSLVIYTGSFNLYKESAGCYLKEAQWRKAFDVLQSFAQSSQPLLLDKRKARLLQWEFIKSKKLAKKQKLIVSSALFDLAVRPEEKKKWRQKGVQIIRSLPFDQKLKYQKERETFSSFAFYLDYKLGLNYFKAKDFPLAEKYFKQALSSPFSKALKKELQSKLLLIKKSKQINPSLIGVILPLSGERKALGEKILRGLAFGLNREKESKFQMIIMDSKNHPDTVKSLVEDLFYNHHVIALIGGLSGEVAEVIAEKAEEFSIPAVLFSQSQGLTQDRHFIFQNAVSPKQLLTPLIQELIGSLEIKRVAIMHPDDSYGGKYSLLFEESFKAAGGEIAGRVSYKLGEFDFKDEVKELLHLKIEGREEEFEELKEEFLKENKNLSARSKKLTPENILAPKKDFSALFIPDSSEARIRIRDHLKYFGLDSIYLAGLNLWGTAQLKEKDFSIIFTSLEKKDEVKSDFYKDFFKSYNRTPGYFEQKAYNTAVFLNQALTTRVKSRLLLQKKLESIKSFQGAYNQIQLSKDRVFQYPIKVYKKINEKKSKN